MQLTPFRLALLTGALAAFSPALAQTKAAPAAAPTKPPVAQLWIDLATQQDAGMPTMGAGRGGALGALGGMLGLPGAAADNAFGNTRGMASGRWADVALVTQRKPEGSNATLSVPQASTLAPSVALLPVRPERQSAAGGRDAQPHEDTDRPKGRVLLYWGCGENVRAGQPRVLDFARSTPQEWGSAFGGRSARERGAQARVGHAIWPNEQDRRALGPAASLVGDYQVQGEGVPAALKFQLSEAHDLMPGIALTQSGSAQGSVLLSWGALPQARGYFINAMGSARGDEGSDMVLWSSAEQPDFGMGLLDYAAPQELERWLKERVVLPASTTQCAVPSGIFAQGGGAMLRMVAYGPELNLAHPPRPTDPKAVWAPEWALRVRSKSSLSALLGAMDGRANRRGSAPAASGNDSATEPEKKPSPVNVLRGILGL